ncbi:type I polyketide synthase [Streptomyces sp. TP-A0874]|uniref:type I polyketide synthase n=1 Tax=Streptomyces sp. TP-A0874 TaxID=549819 RepID=UPI00099F5784|nr:type I polyketide synthase [Streptomyces sp. TP-A0874]
MNVPPQTPAAATSAPESRGGAPEPADEEFDGIAVIGMAGRFPGARDIGEFWANLRSGKESIVDVSEEQLVGEGVPDELLGDPHYVRRAAPVDGVDEFDAEFFDLTPRAARTMDPQQRLLLQLSWHALEDAGYNPLGCDRSVGVFATASVSSYLLYNLLSRQDTRALLGAGLSLELVQLVGGNDPNFVATRVAHALDLRGPAVGVQTACSSGLVAVHTACQSLLSGECDMALAGGVSIRVPHRAGYLYDPGAIMSPDGSCRPFDERAAGTVFGSGGGALLLKPLGDALADGDPVHAVIRGSAINNDGSQKMGFTAPSIDGQAQVVAEALAVAGTAPGSIGYIEAHGTGTALGDPIEVAALATAFDGVGPGRHIALGSVKSNIGHLEVAAGIAGLIKTVLSLKQRELAPTLHYSRPNPELALEKTPFYIADQLSPWTGPGPLRAGVSALGVGGTNAHVVLEEAPPVPAEPSRTGPAVLLLSARTPEQLSESGRLLADRLDGDSPPALVDVAATLATGRHPQQHRRAVVASSPETAAAALRTAGHPSRHEGRALLETPGVVLLMPGQGAQYPGMTKGLHRADSTYRRHFDWAAEGLSDLLGLDVRAAVLDGDEDALRRTDLAQAALFSVEYALASRLAEHGIHPTALAGHSVGEYTAALLAGVFSPEDALRVVAARGALMHAAPPGAMLTVGLPEQAAREAVAGTGLEVAAVNEPGHTVVAGPEAAAGELTERLAARGVSVRRLHTAHAFHTAALDPAAGRFADRMAEVALHVPRIPLLSATTGDWMTDDEARDPGRWARQIRVPVRFSDLLATLLGEPRQVLVECGPGRALTTFARRNPGWGDGHRALRLVRHPREERDDHETYLLGLGALWTAGVDPDWQGPEGGPAGRRVSLPGYPFRRDRHWITPISTDLPTGSWEAAASHDRSAAPADPPAEAGGTPVDRAVRLISTIWTETLGVPDVGEHDNFFDLGGDSVVAVQVASRASRGGLSMTPQDMFRHQTVRALATALAETSGGEDDAVGTASTDTPPLTPTQQWIAEHPGGRLAEFTVPLLLDIGPDVAAEVVREAVGAVVAHHEALRLRLERRDGLWQQRIEPAGDFDVPTIPLPGGLAAVGATIADLGRDLLGRSGPLLRAAILEPVSEGPRRLALVMHHFCVDNASERILLEDLATACGQLMEGRPVRLPEVATEWSAWARWVAGLAAAPEVLAERGEWLELLRADAAVGLPTRSTSREGATRDVRLASTELDQETVEALTRLQRERRARMEEFLLAAVAVAVTEATGEERALLDVEGHGRAALPAGMDLSRTMGTCTTLHPVTVETGRRGMTGAVDSARRAIRSTPREGLGYGVLRTLHAPSARLLDGLPRPDLLVTYLGTVTYDAVAELAGGPLRASTAAELSALAVPGCLLHGTELRAYVHHGRLHLDWWFDAGRYAPEVVAAALDRAASALSTLSQDAAAAPDAAPGSTRWADVNQDEFRMLFGEQHRDM